MRLLSLLFMITFAIHAYGEEEEAPKPAPPQPVWTAHVLREKDPAKRLADLYIHEARLPVMLVARQGGFRTLVDVRGRFLRPGWTISVNNQPILPTTPEGDFSIPAYVYGKVSEFVIVANGPNKESGSERIFIYAPEAREYKQYSPNDAILIGIGGGFMHYSQTGSVYFKALTGLVFGKLNYPTTESRWGLFVGAEATGVTIAAAPIEVGPQLVRGKADLIYRKPRKGLSRWRWEYLGGISYLTMITNGSPFGFSNLISPQFGVRGVYTAGPKTTMAIEFRYVPIKEPFKFENKGMDLEFTWSRILPNVHRLDIGFSYYNFNYHPSDDTRIDTGLLVYRIGYGI